MERRVALALMRAAYAKGYADALSEDEPGHSAAETMAWPYPRGSRVSISAR